MRDIMCMNANINEMKEILLEGTMNDKMELLSHLCDIFESYNRDIDWFEELLEFMVRLVAETQDDNLKDELLETICKAAIYQNIDGVNFDALEQDIPKVSVKYLPRYIDILSYTNNKKYLESVLLLKKHPDESVRTAVEEAIKEMERCDSLGKLVWKAKTG